VDLVRRIVAPTLVLSLFACASMARAEHKLKNEDCLTCHSDKTLTDGDNGKTVSLYESAQVAAGAPVRCGFGVKPSGKIRALMTGSTSQGGFFR
jgi:hypothetical protein